MTRLPHPRNAAVLALGLVLLMHACARDQATQPGESGAIVLDDAFERDSVPAAAVPRDVAVMVRDVTGRPASGVHVVFDAQDRGDVRPASAVSDQAGRAVVRWTLGPDSGEHRLVARAGGFIPLTIRSKSGVGDLLRLGEFHALQLATYDGSGETVHPDYVRIEASRAMGRFLVLTPYEAGSSQFENPAMYASSDLVRWRVPAGAPNPIALPDEMNLSDPDLVYDPVSAEIMLYYRGVGASNKIWLVRSSDAVHWSDPVRILWAPNHEIVSPTIVRRSDTEWLMWAVNTHGGCTDERAEIELRRSTNGVDWSHPEPVSLEQRGYSPWHVDVEWIPSRAEYWAIYNVKTPGSCTTRALYLATSPDGVTWHTFPSPVLESGATPELQDIVYRSTFAYDSASDNVTFWYSGAHYVKPRYVWGTVVQRRSRTELFAHIAARRTFVRVPRRDLPPLLDPP